MDSTERKAQTLKQSAIVTGLSGLGNVTALLTDMVIAAQYGLGSETDALFVAMTIPQLIASLLLVSFNVTLVPIFSSVKVRDGLDSLWDFANNLISICLIVLGVVGILGALCSSLIVFVTAPGLDPDVKQLGSELSAILFFAVIPLGAVEVMKALLNVLHSFAPPASANLLRNGAVVVSTLALGHMWGIKAVAIGYVVGSWLQFPLVGIALALKGYRYKPRLNLPQKEVYETWRSLRLPLLGGAINLSNILIERFLVSFLAAGTVSALGYARRIFSATDTVFLGSIATVFLPRLSDHSAQEDGRAYRRYLDLGIKLSLFIAIPIVAVTIVLGAPAMRLVFQRGAFDQAATQATATYLSLYMLSIPASALIQILMAGFYARHDTVMPFYILIALLGMTLALDALLFAALGAKGLALGLSLAKLLASGLAFLLLRRKVGHFTQELGTFVLKVILASVAMTVAMVATTGVTQRFVETWVTAGSIATAAFQLLFGALVGVAVYGLVALVLRIKEVTRVIHFFKHRFSFGSADSIP